MIEETFEDEFIAYLKQVGDKDMHSGYFKGLPEDKHLDELYAAKEVMKHLGKEILLAEIEPENTNKLKDTAPDLKFILDNEEILGIEVTEFVDGYVRMRHDQRRKKEKELGLSPLEALHYGMDHKNDKIEVTDKVGAFMEHTLWDENSIAKKLDGIIERKDKKKCWEEISDRYDEFWLIIFSDEIMATEDLFSKAILKLNYKAINLNKIYLILSPRLTSSSPTTVESVVLQILN